MTELPEEIVKLIGSTSTYLQEVFECRISIENGEKIMIFPKRKSRDASFLETGTAHRTCIKTPGYSDNQTWNGVELIS